MSVYRIEGRYPAWARWRLATARPHGERHPFNPTTRVLEFPTAEAAEQAAASMRRANSGEYRVKEAS